jgi:SAM-dependent methyltransferase
MIRDTNKDWSKIAEDNPYWGVLSEEAFRGSRLSPKDKERFYASGKVYIENLLGFVKKHIAEDFKIRRGLDFGCGVGRLLIPLALNAEEAVGVDVAPKMVEITRKNLADAGISNATVVLGDDALSFVKGRFNFVNSFIVLQHIPPERGIRLISHLLDILEVGGVFSLQMTYAKERKFFPHEQSKARYYRRAGHHIQDIIQTEEEPPTGTITMFEYDLNEIILLATRISGEPILLLPTNHDGHIGLHLIGMKVRN